MTGRRAWLAIAAAVVLSSVVSCGGPRSLLVLPEGAGVPATDGSAALQQATTACTAARTLSAETRLSGRIAGRRARGRLLVGVASPASAYIDAPAPFGASAFIFAAVGDTSTLLLPRDRRMLEGGRPADVLEAVTGVAVSPQELRELLTGCVSDLDGAALRQLGDNWRLIDGPRRVYLRRDSTLASWRVVAVIHREPGQAEWRSDYADFVNDLPQTIHLASADRTRFDLQLALSGVELNVPLGDDVFHPTVPAGYQPITLEQLRDVGPLAERPDR